MNLPSYNLREKIFLQNGIMDCVKKHMRAGEISEFEDELWDKIKVTKVFIFPRRIPIFIFQNFYKIFKEGGNIGRCGLTAEGASYLFEEFNFVGGTCDILIGTKGAPNGEHVWLEVDGYIYDTTLLLRIKKEIGYFVLGYKPITILNKAILSRNKKYCFYRKLSQIMSMVTKNPIV